MEEYLDGRLVNVIYNRECLTGLRILPDGHVDCCITSPPYYGLRDYGHSDQIGLEGTPDEYIAKLVDVFREVKRVLKDDGTLWVNIGDSYTGYKANTGDTEYAGNVGRPKHKKGWQFGDLKQKDLIGIPWMLAFALRADGWYLRQDIIWHKPNPMPESVTDRCTKAHEYIFLLSKSKSYYYDHVAIMKPVSGSTIDRLDQDIDNQEGSNRVPGKTNGTMKAKASWNGSTFDKGKTGEMMRTHGHRKSGNKARVDGSARGCPENNGVSNLCSHVPWEGMMANKRSVWNVTTKPFKEAHFATFPQDLIVDMVKAGCREGGIILDPFMGAGTTAVVARKLNRNFIGFEVNEKYVEIANKRIDQELGIFK